MYLHVVEIVIVCSFTLEKYVGQMAGQKTKGDRLRQVHQKNFEN